MPIVLISRRPPAGVPTPVRERAAGIYPTHPVPCFVSHANRPRSTGCGTVFTAPRCTAISSVVKGAGSGMCRSVQLPCDDVMRGAELWPCERYLEIFECAVQWVVPAGGPGGGRRGGGSSAQRQGAAQGAGQARARCKQRARTPGRSGSDL